MRVCVSNDCVHALNARGARATERHRVAGQVALSQAAACRVADDVNALAPSCIPRVPSRGAHGRAFGCYHASTACKLCQAAFGFPFALVRSDAWLASPLVVKLVARPPDSAQTEAGAIVQREAERDADIRVNTVEKTGNSSLQNKESVNFDQDTSSCAQT